MTDVDRLKYDALSRQLGRMRAMQYAYNRKFFSLLLATVIAIPIAFSLDTLSALTMLAFGLVTAGVTASFFLHFCDFARTYARALEARIDRLLGERILVASALEADYFYPHETRKVSGFVPSRPGSFFSFFTLHFVAVWGAAIGAALWRLRHSFDGSGYTILLGAFAAWSAVNVGFLLTWFRGDAERRMAATLREVYGLEENAR
jgi:hypothetical protein